MTRLQLWNFMSEANDVRTAVTKMHYLVACNNTSGDATIKPASVGTTIPSYRNIDGKCIE